MKQTAVEWYNNQLKEIDFKLQSQLINFEQCKALMSYTFELAKQMEKDRMIQFCKDYSTSLMYGDGLTEEEFYNQTFKSE